MSGNPAAPGGSRVQGTENPQTVPGGAHQPGGIPWKLAPYPGLHVKHRDDGGRYRKK